MEINVKKIMLLMSLLALCSTANAANPGALNPGNGVMKERFVKNSYIVTFKAPGKGMAPIVKAPDKLRKGRVPFGMHSSGQSKTEIAERINLRGEVVSIFDSINAIHVKMDAKEADRLSRQGFVQSVERDGLAILSAVQNNPGWGLDRLDEPSARLDNNYTYTYSGAGRTIYVLDSGLNLGDPEVFAEFGGRASVFWDVNGGTGNDCIGHGTSVSSVIGGNTYGVAKGATIIMAKVSTGCTGSVPEATQITAFNWLAANAPAGTIVNLSVNFSFGVDVCNGVHTNLALENAVRAAHNAGVIVVISAGNDRCNVNNYSPTNIPEVFVVGATDDSGIPGQDRLVGRFDTFNGGSRRGANISAFAPGNAIRAMDQNGNQVVVDGTSFSAPYIAGVFAVACESVGTYCDTTPTATLYDALRNTGTLNTVTDPDGTPLTGATSRFISQQW